MRIDIQDSFLKLRYYCERKDFSGWDPYDGLNSKVFSSLPFLQKNRFARLAWIQLFKRSPVNLRRLMMVPREVNPKGIALFLNGYCFLYNINPTEEYLTLVKTMGEELVSLQTKGYSGACWGYNFDWQAKAFFQPKYTPTVVATTFAAYALLDAWEITRNEEFKNTALSAAEFVMKDLNRTTDEEGDFAFSYSPQDRTSVFNASLLGSRLLARVYTYTGNKDYLDAATKSVAYCCKHQNANGSWFYSPLPWHQWIDSFHTGYNLECLHEYQLHSGDDSFAGNFERGFEFYVRSFFTPEGIPKYYNNNIYPVDVHTTAQLLVTLFRTGKLDDYQELAENVLNWTIKNMQAPDGHFFYQKNKYYLNRIPYMRWTQAWMFYGMSQYLFSFFNR